MTIMNLKKYKKRAASLGMAFLLTTGLFSFQAFAEDESDENANIASLSFEIELEIEGDIPDKDVPFTFILEEEEDDDTDKQAEDVLYTTIHGKGITVFDEITFTEPGDYEYVIYERNDGLENYVYDDNTYHMEIEVKYDRRGKLVATCTASSEKAREGKESELLFVNTYDDPDSDSEATTEETDTTEELTTTEETATTEELTTTEETTTTEELTTTEETTTTEELTTTEETTTTEELTTTEESTTTEELTTTEESGTPKKPKTGDDTNIPLVIALLCVAVIGMTGCIRCRYMAGKHNDEHKRS